MAAVKLELTLALSHSPSLERTSFALERAVCSHGLFMMAPNVWDPVTRSLSRPLRLASGLSVGVRISQPSPSSLLIHVSSCAPSLSAEDRDFILEQVKRMLRLSELDDLSVRGFHKVHSEARECGFGRIFRSPTLFEDMVKCILLCNCQWGRSLSMAEALCELQLELGSNISEDFHPKTPQPAEGKRKRRSGGTVAVKLGPTYSKNEAMPVDDSGKMTDLIESPHLLESEETYLKKPTSESVSNCYNLLDNSLKNAALGTTKIGNFPTPEELAHVNVGHLAKRCKLGYRAQRIVSLAQSIVEGKINLKMLEELCGQFEQHNYDILDKELSAISGFGPFTRANVLMCMGFFHKVPADTETIRHLKKFHNISTTIRTIPVELEKIYSQYEPYQFMAYWFELWRFYNTQFGKICNMEPSQYKLFTASKLEKGRRKVVQSCC